MRTGLDERFDVVFERIRKAKDQAIEKEDSGTVDHMEVVGQAVQSLKLEIEIDEDLRGLFT